MEDCYDFEEDLEENNLTEKAELEAQSGRHWIEIDA